METKFTKAKLFPVEYAGSWDIQDGQYYGDNSVLDAEQVGEIEAEANAKLFAAAPEMLEALVKISEWLVDETPIPTEETMTLVWDAIKKATE